MRLFITIIFAFSSMSALASDETVHNWRANSLISQDSVIEHIYEYAYDMFIGDDGETCEPVLEYAELKEFVSNKEFIIQADLSISNIYYWACTYLINEQRKYELKFNYDIVRGKFEIQEVK